MIMARHHLPIGLACALVVLTSHLAAEQSRRDTGVLDPATIQPEVGHCYTVPVTLPGCLPHDRSHVCPFRAGGALPDQ